MDKDTNDLRQSALLDPATAYGSPQEVEQDSSLSPADKLAILQRWEAQAQQLAEAEQESMSGGEPNRLGEVGAARLRMEDVVSSHPDPAQGDRPAPRAGHFARPVGEIIHADQEIDEAALRLSMQEHPFLPVADGDEIVGVLTYTDLARGRRARALESAPLTARVLMSTGFAFCYQDDAVTTAHALMDRHGREHLLVVDADGALVGMLRRADLPASAQAPGNPQHSGMRQEPGRGIADPAPPSGLDVYADRPRVRIAQR